MPKKSMNSKYIEAASKKVIEECCAKLEEIRKKKRKPKKMKIEPIIPTVIRCLQLGKSSRQIASIVSQAHAISISKDSVLRFSKTLPQSIRK